jgi:invasion protein IalB
LSKLHARITFVVGVLAAALVFTAVLTSVATAQKAKPAKKSAASPPGWSVKCADRGKGLKCKAQQTIAVRKTRKRLLTVSVGRADKGKSGTALLHLPHGLYLPDGVKFGIDATKPQSLQVQTCDAGGCYAAAKLKVKDLAAMQSGKKLAISFKNLKKRQITVEMPLAGFGAAYKKLK